MVYIQEKKFWMDFAKTLSFYAMKMILTLTMLFIKNEVLDRTILRRELYVARETDDLWIANHHS